MKCKTHTQYRNKNKTRLPGVTTITGELGWNKRVLMKWANNLGLQGIDSSKYTDDKADIGTLAHAMVTNELLGKPTDTSDYSENQIEQALNCKKSWDEWRKGKKIEPILIEEPLVSEIYQYGGTPDIYALVDGVKELIDLKTGKGIYPEYYIQVVAYRQLLQEQGHMVDKIRILNIPRSDDESFQQKIVTKLGVCWGIFYNLLLIYKVKKELT